MGAMLKRFAADQSGSTAVEYALIGTLIAVVCYAAFASFGGGLQNLFGANGGGAAPEMEDAATTAAGS